MDQALEQLDLLTRFSVRRHLSKNRPGLPQKSLENSFNEGEGTQGPRCARTQWRRGAFLDFFKVVAAITDRIVVFAILPTAVFPSWSCDFCSETRRLQPSSRLRAVGVTAPPHFYGGFDAVLARRRFKRDNGSFRTVLFSVLFVPATHFIASPRSLGIGRLQETVKHLAVSPCPLRLGLRSGLTVYFEEEIEAFVFHFLQRSTSSTGSPRRSLRCHPRTGWIFCPSCPRTPRSFKAPLTPSRGRGEMEMVAPCYLPLFGTACAVGLI